MKKITSKEPISLRIDGQTVLEIDSKGCLASDTHAAIAVERLGANITVEDVSSKEAAKLADDADAGDAGEGDELSLADLKAKAKGYGLPVSGTKDDLKARIAEHEAQNPAE